MISANLQMLPALSSMQIKVLTHEPTQSGHLAEMSLSLKSLTSNADGHKNERLIQKSTENRPPASTLSLGTILSVGRPATSSASIGVQGFKMDPDKPMRLKDGKLEVIPTGGEGHCLYHAMAALAHYSQHPRASLFYDPSSGGALVEVLRRAIHDVLLKGWDYYSLEYPEMKRLGRQKFLDGVLSNKFGGEPEIDAALEVFTGVSIRVWRDVNGVFTRDSIFMPNEESSRKSLSEAWNILQTTNHFAWMRPMDRAPEAATSPLAFQTSTKKASRAPPANKLLMDLELERRQRAQSDAGAGSSAQSANPETKSSDPDLDATLAMIKRIKVEDDVFLADQALAWSLQSS